MALVDIKALKSVTGEALFLLPIGENSRAEPVAVVSL